MRSQKLVLYTRQAYVTGRYDYSAIDAPGETIITGIKPKKLANEIFGVLANHVSDFCQRNRLAGLLDTLGDLEPLLVRIHGKNDTTGSKTVKLSVDEQQLLLDLLNWIKAHKRESEEQEHTAYLSLDREQYIEDCARWETERRRKAQGATTEAPTT